jgi:hypothetical protein
MPLIDQIVVDLDFLTFCIYSRLTGKMTLTDQIVVDLESSQTLVLLKTYRLESDCEKTLNLQQSDLLVSSYL